MKSNNQIKLAVINCCYSENVAQMFIDAGVPSVISVCKDLKIEDKVSCAFISDFYRELFTGGKSLNFAF